MLKYDKETGRYHQRIEEHIAVTSEPDWSYIMHYTPSEADPPSMSPKEVVIRLHK